MMGCVAGTLLWARQSPFDSKTAPLDLSTLTLDVGKMTWVTGPAALVLAVIASVIVTAAFHGVVGFLIHLWPEMQKEGIDLIPDFKKSFDSGERQFRSCVLQFYDLITRLIGDDSDSDSSEKPSPDIEASSTF